MAQDRRQVPSVSQALSALYFCLRHFGTVTCPCLTGQIPSSSFFFSSPIYEDFSMQVNLSFAAREYFKTKGRTKT